jgi:hypothetical protein
MHAVLVRQRCRAHPTLSLQLVRHSCRRSSRLSCWAAAAAVAVAAAMLLCAAASACHLPLSRSQSARAPEVTLHRRCWPRSTWFKLQPSLGVAGWLQQLRRIAGALEAVKFAGALRGRHVLLWSDVGDLRVHLRAATHELPPHTQHTISLPPSLATRLQHTTRPLAARRSQQLPTAHTMAPALMLSKEFGYVGATAAASFFV